MTPLLPRGPGIGELRREQAPAAHAPRNGVAVPTSLPKCPASACGQKTTLGAPRWRLPEVLRPTESPDRQRSGWRPQRSGDQEGDGRPGYPRRSGRPRDGGWWDTDRVHPREGTCPGDRCRSPRSYGLGKPSKVTIFDKIITVLTRYRPIVLELI